MTLSDFLQDVGKPFQYYPSLAALIGVKECIFLCRLIWWTGYEKSQDGWIYKSQEGLLEETGLSFEEQLTARKHLKAQGLLVEKWEAKAHRMHYRVTMEKLDDLWANRKRVRRGLWESQTRVGGLGFIQRGVSGSSREGSRVEPDSTVDTKDTFQRRQTRETVSQQSGKETPKGAVLGKPPEDGTAEPLTSKAIPLAVSQSETAPLQKPAVSPKAPKPQTPAQKAMLRAEQLFVDGYKRRFGIDPDITYGRDRKTLKEFFERHPTLAPERWARIVQAGWDSRNAYLAGRCKTISGAVAVWNDIATLKPVQAAEPVIGPDGQEQW